MFESDDFDQVLSQLDFPEIPTKTDNRSIFCDKDNYYVNNTIEATSFKEAEPQSSSNNDYNISNKGDDKTVASNKPLSGNSIRDTFISPKHSKRKIINSHFDHKSKRKFPGPAGLLTGSLEQNKDETICHMELLSQDIEYSQNTLRKDLFKIPLWLRLLDDAQSWSLNVEHIKSIKQQALAGNLKRRKAQTVTAFVETVDRSVTDPLIILRDSTGHIKCTLHRDAWSTFSPYLVSEYCALILWKPTILTTGSAFKKHYLNITLSNIYAIYSSAVFKEEEQGFPEGYVKVYEEDFTVMKAEKLPHDIGTKSTAVNGQVCQEGNLLDDLDSIFSDELF